MARGSATPPLARDLLSKNERQTHPDERRQLDLTPPLLRDELHAAVLGAPEGG